MKTTFAMLCMVAALALVAGSALAEDLSGEWKEVDNWGARAGASGHALGDGDTFLSSSNAGFTLKVTEMGADGRAFHGQWCSANDCEDVVGAVRSDGSIVAVDEDGYFTGTLLHGTLELCYMEAGREFRVANCRIMKR